MTVHHSNDAQPSASAAAGRREWYGLAFLALPTILLGADLTLLHLALPALAADLQPSSTQALWIMDAYGFMIAGLLVTMGTLGDRIGRRKLLMIGAFAFGVTSLLAAFATTPSMLILCRAALGIAAATLMPSTLALISNMFLRRGEKALAIGVWATMFAFGMAVGPVLGGLLLQHFWWGSAFLAAVPVVLLVLVGAPLLLPEYRAENAGRIDLLSVVLSLAGIVPVIYGIKQMAIGEFLYLPLLAMVFGSFVLTLFVRRQQRLDDPLLDLQLFRSAGFTVALIILLVGWIAVAGIMLLVTQYLQLVAQLSPLQAGLWLGPPALAQVAAGIAAPLLARYVRPAFVAAYALLISVAGFVVLSFVSSAGHGIGLVVTGFSLAYVGLGAIAALGTDLVIGAAPEAKAGSASALSETVQDLGVSLGIAALGSLSTAIYRADLLAQPLAELSAEVNSALTDSLWSAMAVKSQVPADLIAAAQVAFTHSLSWAAGGAAIVVACLAVLAVVMLRHVKSTLPDDEKTNGGP
jgi:DHA2 family multidrug resistance protein-like MFS transporter